MGYDSLKVQYFWKQVLVELSISTQVRFSTIFFCMHNHYVNASVQLGGDIGKHVPLIFSDGVT